jgi:hypothetical protein
MKAKEFFILFFVAATVISCSTDYIETVTYKINEPIVVSHEEFRQMAKVSVTPQQIENHGKICFYNGYIFMAETGKGIHIIDNRSAQNPQIVGFIQLVGNADMAVRNNILYADALTDLVWFDLTNPAAPMLAGSLENAFAGALPPIDDYYGYDYQQVQAAQQNNGVVIGWKLTERTEQIHHSGGGWWNGGKYYDDTTSPTMTDGGSQGINGSMSRFSLHNGYLYSVINNQMSIIDLSGAMPVKAVDNLYIGNNVETIFNYQDKMFMGTPTGMLIYSVASPTNPQYCSSLQHVFGCDPVVVENDIAYVTVHSGNICGQNSNELIIIDVSDVYNPVQIVSYTMTCPTGLGIDNETLFVCDNGLKIFNAANPQTIMSSPNILAHYTGMNGYDVIPLGNILIMIAEDGLYQYDYSDLNNIYLLSVINW